MLGIDIPPEKSYSELMGEETPFLTITLDLNDPIELDDFVAFFAALSSQFERFAKSDDVNIPEARFFVKEVRKGSIVADLIAVAPAVIEYMDEVVIVASFAELLRRTLKKFAKGQTEPGLTKGDLKDFQAATKAIAKDSKGKAVIEKATFKSGFIQKEVVFSFSTVEARDALKTIEHQQQILDATTAPEHQRVMMVFKRTDRADSAINKKSGERVIIEEISPKDRALIYASDLAEQHIKHEIRESEDNVYKKGFIVDVNAVTKSGKVVAYSVTNYHHYIDLPDDEGDDPTLLIEG